MSPRIAFSSLANFLDGIEKVLDVVVGQVLRDKNEVCEEFVADDST